MVISEVTRIRMTIGPNTTLLDPAGNTVRLTAA